MAATGFRLSAKVCRSISLASRLPLHPREAEFRSALQHRSVGLDIEFAVSSRSVRPGVPRSRVFEH